MTDVEHCSFCLRSSEEVARLIGGANGVRICDECVASCDRILADPTIPFPGFDGEDDETLLTRLPVASRLVESSDVGLRGLVDVLRERRVSWARIGAALDVSRQAAWERFG